MRKILLSSELQKCKTIMKDSVKVLVHILLMCTYANLELRHKFGTPCMSLELLYGY